MKADIFIAEALNSGRYAADSDGQIHSHKFGDRVLRAGTLPSGYQVVCLNLRGKSCTAYVHRIVAFAYHGLPPTPEHEVNHKNGQKSDNRPSNLEWVTPSENWHHAARTGLRRPMKGKSEDPTLIAEVAHLLAKGISQRQIATRLGINKNTVNKVALRVSHR
jgi:hypothetical protein